MERVRIKPMYAVLAAAVLALIVIPIAVAGASSDSRAPTSATVTKQVKKLKRQVSQLRRQLDQVAQQAGPQGPEGPQGAVGPPGPATGPAGGDLTGTYPNPLIGPAAVGSAELADNAVTGAKIQTGAINTTDIENGEVRDVDLGQQSVDAATLKNGAVDSFALRDVVAVVSSATTVNAGTPANAQVTCPFGRQLIAGGYAWQDDEPNSIIANAPSETDPNHTWIVRGMVNSGSNSLFAWATCLP